MMTAEKRQARGERKRAIDGRAKIAELLYRNDRAVERAMVVLYARQTRDEQATSNTRHENQRGFSAFHAASGSYYARWVLRDNRLTGVYLEKARKISLRYTGQLLDEANKKKRPAKCAGCDQFIPADGYCACRGYGD